MSAASKTDSGAGIDVVSGAHDTCHSDLQFLASAPNNPINHCPQFHVRTTTPVVYRVLTDKYAYTLACIVQRSEIDELSIGVRMF